MYQLITPYYKYLPTQYNHHEDVKTSLTNTLQIPRETRNLS